MQHRNKLGVFSFDDDVQPSHMKLIVSNVMGQYFNPKSGEPRLVDEEDCVNFIKERCGQVLSDVPFDLVINEDVRKEEIDNSWMESLAPKFEQAAVAFELFAKNIANAFAKIVVPQ